MKKAFLYYAGQQCKVSYNHRLFPVIRKCDLHHNFVTVDFVVSQLMRDLSVTTFCKRANLSKDRDAKLPV
jgi:hypothetical protein